MLFFILSVNSFVEGGKSDSKNLAIASIFQNERLYIQEWIDYHIAHGVNHFYLYNNNSTDDFMAVLRPYIKKGAVELIDWPSEQKADEWTHHCYETQLNAFKDAIQRAKKKYRWLALIDTDEYIVCPGESNIAKCLKKNYDSYAGVCVNWVMYGTSNVERAPYGKMIEALCMRAPLDHPLNRYWKSIVNPACVKDCINPHFCLYKKGYFHVNAQGNRVESDMGGVFVDRIRINHYWTKDIWFLENVKIPRYTRWGRNADDIRKTASELNAEFDDTILKQ